MMLILGRIAKLRAMQMKLRAMEQAIYKIINTNDTMRCAVGIMASNWNLYGQPIPMCTLSYSDA